jgi:hypothetical protein
MCNTIILMPAKDSHTNGVGVEWHLLKRMYPSVFDPRYAVNPSLEARLRHPCRRRPRIEHTGAPQITVVELSKCHWGRSEFNADPKVALQPDIKP